MTDPFAKRDMSVDFEQLRRLDSNEAEVAERQQLAEVSNVGVFLRELYSLLIIIDEFRSCFSIWGSGFLLIS